MGILAEWRAHFANSTATCPGHAADPPGRWRVSGRHPDRPHFRAPGPVECRDSFGGHGLLLHWTGPRPT